MDGKPADIHLADGLFQAVAIKAGDKEARLSYEPTSFRFGLFLSLISLWVVGVLDGLASAFKKTVGILDKLISRRKHLPGNPQNHFRSDSVHAFSVVMGRPQRWKTGNTRRTLGKRTKGVVARAAIQKMLQVTVARITGESPSISPTGPKEGKTRGSQGLGHVLGRAICTD